MVDDKIWKRTVPQTLPTCILNDDHQLVIPKHALTNQELSRYAACLKIPFFRGVFMKDALPAKVWKNETGIVNLDNTDGPGTLGCVIKNFKIKYIILIVLAIYHHHKNYTGISKILTVYFTTSTEYNCLTLKSAGIYVWSS